MESFDGRRNDSLYLACTMAKGGYIGKTTQGQKATIVLTKAAWLSGIYK